MAEKKPQTYENHAKIVPSYHIVAFVILVINAGWSIYRLIREPSLDAVVNLLLAAALLLLFFHLRIFPLTVQDRVIRLEMRLRLERILPADLRERIGELSHGQLVALRFASDGELPELVREVLDGNITDRKEIKLKIKDWQPDHLRC